MDTFENELRSLINKYNKESESNTPDFILRDYILKCLEAFNEGINSREKWFHR